MLESSEGYCVTDQDYTVHKFMIVGNRDVQLIMDVEIKTMAAEVSIEQADTLHIKNQLMRKAGTLVDVVSVKNKRMVKARPYGVHVLRFSGLGPDDSERIRWDKHPITINQLTSILRFDLDPDTLEPIDLRDHDTVSTRVIGSAGSGEVRTATGGN